MIAIIVECAVLATVCAVFKAFRVSSEIAWRVLVNGLSGAAALLLINTVFVGKLGIKPLFIPPGPLSAAAVGTLGVPGALLLIIIRMLV